MIFLYFKHWYQMTITLACKCWSSNMIQCESLRRKLNNVKIYSVELQKRKENMEGALWMSGDSLPHIEYCLSELTECEFVCPQSASID